MPSNSSISHDSDGKNNSKSEQQTKNKNKHTENETRRDSKANVVQKTLEEKIADALKTIHSEKRQTQENPSPKIVPLRTNRFSYYKITARIVENKSILKTTFKPLQNTHQKQESDYDKPLTEENKAFKGHIQKSATCSEHEKFFLGALASAYRPQLKVKEQQLLLTKVRSQKQTKTKTEHSKEGKFNAIKQAQSETKSSICKLIYGAITPFFMSVTHQELPVIDRKDQQQEKVTAESLASKMKGIKMNTKEMSLMTHLSSLYRPKLYKKQNKQAIPMKLRNEAELKMKDKLLKLLLDLKNTTEETENIIKVFYQLEDLRNLQNFVNTQLDKTISAHERKYAHKKCLPKIQKLAHISLESKKLKENKKYQSPKVDASKIVKQKATNVQTSNDNKKLGEKQKSIQIETSIRSIDKLSERSKITDTEPKKNTLNITREKLLKKEQKHINFVSQKVKPKNGTMEYAVQNRSFNEKDNNDSELAKIKKAERAKNDKKEKLNTSNQTENEPSTTKEKFRSITLQKKEKTPVLHMRDSKYNFRSEVNTSNSKELEKSDAKPDEYSSEWIQKHQLKEQQNSEIESKSDHSKKGGPDIPINEKANKTETLIPSIKQQKLKHNYSANGGQNTTSKENKVKNDKGETENITTHKQHLSHEKELKLHKSKVLPLTAAIKRQKLKFSEATNIKLKRKNAFCCKLRTRTFALKEKMKKSGENAKHSTIKTNTAISPSNNTADKIKSKETEDPKGQPVKHKTEQPLNTRMDMKKLPEKQKNDFIKSKGKTVVKTAIKSQSSRGGTSNGKKENENFQKKERHAMNSKTDTNISKKEKKDRQATKAELKEIEIQRKQELQALKEKLQKPKTTTYKKKIIYDIYYEYLQEKLKQTVYKKHKNINIKSDSKAINKNVFYIANKKEILKTNEQYKTERPKIQTGKSKVLPQNEIDKCFKCSPLKLKDSHTANKSHSAQNTLSSKCGPQRSCLTYEDLNTIMKLKTNGHFCQKLKKETNPLKATHLEECPNSKSVMKEVKHTTVEKLLTDKDTEIKEKKISEFNGTAKYDGDNIKTKSECKNKEISDKLAKIASSNTTDVYSQQKCNQFTRGNNFKDTNMRIKKLYSFATPVSHCQVNQKKQISKEIISIKQIINMKEFLSIWMKQKLKLIKALQNRLRRMRESVQLHKDAELKAKLSIKRVLLKNLQEAVRITDLKNGFRNNIHWNILKKGIQNNIHQKQIVNAIKQSLNSLCLGLKGSVNSKELKLALKEGIKHREIFAVMKQSINMPLLFRSLLGATKDYIKVKYNTLKQAHKESGKKKGGGSGGHGCSEKKPSNIISNSNIQKKQIKLSPNELQTLFKVNNRISKQITKKLMMREIKKLMTEILSFSLTVPKQSVEYFPFFQLHKHFPSKRLMGLNTKNPPHQSKLIYKNIITIDKLVPFSLKLFNFTDGKTGKKRTFQNEKQTNQLANVSSNASKSSNESMPLQSLQDGNKNADRYQISNGMHFKQCVIKPHNVLDYSLPEHQTDKNIVTSSINERLSLNQLLRDIFSLRDRKSEHNEAVTQKLPEEAFCISKYHKLHNANKTYIPENAVQSANTTLKHKMLMFFLKHDLIYLAEDITKPLSLQTGASNKEENILLACTPNDKSSMTTTENKYSSTDKIDNVQKPKIRQENTAEKLEHKFPSNVTAPKTDKIPPLNNNVQPEFTGFSKHFNSVTITGRANVAKATLACLAIGYLYYHFHKKNRN